MKKSTKALSLNRDTLRLMEKDQMGKIAAQGTKNTLTGCDGFAGSNCPNTCFC